MQSEIIRKLNCQLEHGFEQEADVIYVMAEVRKLFRACTDRTEIFGFGFVFELDLAYPNRPGQFASFCPMRSSPGPIGAPGQRRTTYLQRG